MANLQFNNKLKRTFVREEAYLILRDRIVQGILKPGQQLRDKELAEHLGVSRTPIREALLRLEDDGFVVTKPNRSTTVSRLRFDDVLDVYSIVWTLEKMAMEQALVKMEDQHLSKLKEFNEKLKYAIEEGDQLASVEWDNDFHGIFINLSDNEELKQTLLRLKQKLKRFELYYFDKAKDVYLSCKEHDEIISAVEKKNLAQAQHAIENNWCHSYTRIRGDQQKEEVY